MTRLNVTKCYGSADDRCPFCGGLDVLGDKVVCRHPKRACDFLAYVPGSISPDCPFPENGDVVIGVGGRKKP